MTLDRRETLLQMSCERSHLVVRGEIIDAHGYEGERTIRTMYTVLVTEMLKGAVASPGSTTEFSMAGGHYNGRSTMIVGGKRPAMGREYILFLRKCPGRTILLVPELLTEVQDGEVSGGTVEPTPLGEFRDYLETFIERTSIEWQASNSAVAVSGTLESVELEPFGSVGGAKHGSVRLAIDSIYKQPESANLMPSDVIDVAVPPLGVWLGVMGSVPRLVPGEELTMFLVGVPGNWMIGPTQYSVWYKEGTRAVAKAEDVYCGEVEYAEVPWSYAVSLARRVRK